MPKVSFLGRVTVLAALPLIFWIALAFFSGLISRHAFLDYVAWANSPVVFNIRVRRFDSNIGIRISCCHRGIKTLSSLDRNEPLGQRRER